MTIEQIYNEFTQQLKSIYETREAANITDWVFESVAGIKRLDRIINKRKQLSHSTIQQLNHALLEFLQHKPVQYVLQEAWFYKMKFFVNESVLIPRPETEELVEWVINEVKNKNEKLKIIDIGTGSGCIAIALKKEINVADVLAIDISAGALAVAKKNAVALDVNIEIFQTDFLDEKEWHSLSSFDIIVSNPPYIAKKEISTMQKNVIDYEPHIALFVDDDDHLVFYKKIALFAESHLNKEGKIYVEVNEKYAREVNELFNRHGFVSIIKKDIYGRDRMISAYR